MLFPSELDKNNRIRQGEQLLLPRPAWLFTVAGAAGMDTLLVMVTDSPRDLNSLHKKARLPFSASLNDKEGRATLGALVTNARSNRPTSCNATDTRFAGHAQMVTERNCYRSKKYNKIAGRPNVALHSVLAE